MWQYHRHAVRRFSFLQGTTALSVAVDKAYEAFNDLADAKRQQGHPLHVSPYQS